jgi:hypothetical protein
MDIKTTPLTDQQLELCWQEAQLEATADELVWLLYGHKVSSLADYQATK